MLKLEKIAKTLEISITLREREHFLNKTFVQALIIAIGLHLFAGVLFNVRFIKITASQSIFPPAFVEADLSILSDNSVVAVAEEEDNHLKHFIEAKGSKPPAPEFTTRDYIQQTIQLNKACEWEKNPFIAIESQINQQSIPLPTFSKNKSFKPVSVSVSGGLDPIALIDEGWGKMDFSILKKLTTPYYRVIFSVRLDNQSGCLFWHEFKTDRSNKELDYLAEYILKNMCFDINKDLFATLGEVEIVFQKAGK
jgi:hypothetical protein